MLWLMIEAPVTGVLAAARVVKHSQSRWTMFGWAGARAARSTFTASKAVHDLGTVATTNKQAGSLRTTTIFVRD
jgi:hypothetical protein